MILKCLTIFLVFAFNSCMQEEDVKKNLLSGDRDLIIESAIWIQKHDVKDTNIVIQLLTHILDPRICTSMRYYMETPYLNRIAALEKITEKKSPYKVEEDLNALIVDFYLDWAMNKGLIKTKDDVDIVAPYLKGTHDSNTFKSHILNQEKVTWLAKYKWKRKPFGNRLHN